MAWPKGKPRAEGAGRKKGTPNKATLEWKALAKSICESPDHQAALKAACLTDLNLLVKVAEHAFGKPKQSSDVTLFEGYVLPKGDDIEDPDVTD